MPVIKTAFSIPTVLIVSLIFIEIYYAFPFDSANNEGNPIINTNRVNLVRSGIEYGIAGGYPHDIGIDKNPAVIFSENFEEAVVDSMAKRWEDVSGRQKMSFLSDAPALSGGKQSIYFNGGAHLYRRLQPGYDTLFVRFYVKFGNECNFIHHFVHIGGYNPSTPWPQGGAGEKPVGNERWTTGIEPMGTSWAWDFYTYWMHMRTNPDTKFWGNTFSGRPSPFAAPKGEWICVEAMVIMNAPVSAFNGEQAFWINGERKIHLGNGFPKGKWVWDGFYPDSAGTPFEGFQWRSDPGLPINFLWLLHYVDVDTGCTCRFDDVVAARKYIGPMVNQVQAVKSGSLSGTATPSVRVMRRYESATSISVYYTVRVPGTAAIYLYSVNGKVVALQKNQCWNPGSYSMAFDNCRLGEGMYLLLCALPDRQVVRKVFLIE
jgi:hypothetical protein